MEINQYCDDFNIFCLPPAGSSSSIYFRWKEYSHQKINIIPLDYLGHGKNIKFPLSYDPAVIATHLISEIEKYTNKPYAIFGHSVGGSVLWRIEEQLRKNTALYQKLTMLIVSGRPAPSHLKNMHKKSNLTDHQLLEEVKSYNNFPSEILNNKDALNFFINILKNDFKLSDAMLNDQPLLTNKPVMCIYGKEDPFISQHHMMADWKNYTSQWLDAYAVQGDHFYFLDEDILKESLSIISTQIFKLIKK